MTRKVVTFANANSENTIMEKNDALNVENSTEVDAKKQQVNVLKKDYVLNDLEALKKKMNNESRNPGISITGEASNGSCTTVGMKTSLFEYSKVWMFELLSVDERIVDVIPVQKVVADSNHHGQADVEYQLEVQFIVGGHMHKVKLLCYTTTCNILVQNMDGKSESKDYIDNRHPARFFTEEFIIPFGKRALEKEPSLDDRFLPQLRTAIKKLQELHFKNKKKILKPLPKDLPKSIKCGNENCCLPGGNLITKNVNAYAQCALCSGCEHYKCARVKDVRKTNIMNGSEKFVCI